MTRSIVGACVNACACACDWNADAMMQAKIKRPMMRTITSHLLLSTLVAQMCNLVSGSDNNRCPCRCKSRFAAPPGFASTTERILTRGALGQLRPVTGRRGRLSQQQPGKCASQQHTGKDMLDVMAGNKHACRGVNLVVQA